jgi:hypothetical protein
MPRHRLNIATTWTRGNHAATLSADYVSSVSLLRRYDNDVTYALPYCHYGAASRPPPTSWAACRTTVTRTRTATSTNG